MSTMSTVARVAKKIVKAPLRTGATLLAADFATKAAFRLIHKAGIEVNTCPDSSFPLCLQTDFNPKSVLASSESLTKALFVLGTTSLAYLFVKSKFAKEKLGTTLLASAAATNLLYLKDVSPALSNGFDLLKMGLGAVTLAYFFAKTNLSTIKFGIAMILTATIGNWAEWTIFGNVTDFLQNSIRAWRPFNIADMTLGLGGLSLLYDCFIRTEEDNSVVEKPKRKRTIAWNLIKQTSQQTVFYLVSDHFLLSWMTGKRNVLHRLGYTLSASILRSVFHRGQGGFNHEDPKSSSKHS